jgi:hypothetical protein
MTNTTKKQLMINTTINPSNTQYACAANDSTDCTSLIKKYILLGLPRMQKNKAYKLRQICQLTAKGRRYWNKDLNPTDTGHRISQMVKAGLLPLTEIGKASDNALLYKTI